MVATAEMPAAVLPRAILANLSVGIVGAGIGGLVSSAFAIQPASPAKELTDALQATAVGLAGRGFKRVTVYESAPEVGEVGAGIQVRPFRH